MSSGYEDAGDINLDEEIVLLQDGSRLTEARAEQLGARLAELETGIENNAG
ncbi:MAG: hypothetical protein WKF79_02345 [Nocardioides sp.]